MISIETNNLNKFRINARNIFVTYNYVALKLTKDEVIKQLSDKIGIKNYLLAEENKSHYHVFLEFFSKCDIKNSSFFDLFFNNAVIAGNYIKATNIQEQLLDIMAYDSKYIQSDGVKNLIRKKILYS